MELHMFDRRALGDLALAVMLVLPIAAFSMSQPAASHPGTSAASMIATADRVPAGRVGLLG